VGRTKRALVASAFATTAVCGTMGCGSGAQSVGPSAPKATTLATTSGSSLRAPETVSAVTAPAGPPFFPHTLFTSGQVASWPLDPNSATIVANLVSDYKTEYGSVGVNSLPLYSVPAKEAQVPLRVTPGCNNFLPSTGRRIPVPPYVSLNGSGDNPLVIYQPSTGWDWELWQTARSPLGGYQACWGGKLNVRRSSGIFPWPFGLSATGISYLATAITQADVASGQIDHALALEGPDCNGFVYPADRGDCATDPGQPAEGQWFRLPADLPVPRGLGLFARMVFVALQKYGAVITDRSGAVMIQEEQPVDWGAEGHRGLAPTVLAWAGQPEFAVVANLPWSQLQVVDPPQLSALTSP